MNRRTFLTSSCSACLLTGAGLLPETLSSCASPPVYSVLMKNNRIEVPLSLLEQQSLQIVRIPGFEYEIAVERRGDNYRALLLRCTHAENPLTYTGKRFLCSLHGSTFDAQGHVTKGPATVPLQSLKTIVAAESVVIIVRS